MSKATQNFWCYSTNEENFMGNYATEAEAHHWARQQLDEDHGPGYPCTYWVGQIVHAIDKITTEQEMTFIGGAILDGIEESASLEIAADDQIFKMEPDDIRALGCMVLAFVKEKAVANFFGVDRSLAHTYTTGEIANQKQATEGGAA